MERFSLPGVAALFRGWRSTVRKHGRLFSLVSRRSLAWRAARSAPIPARGLWLHHAVGRSIPSVSDSRMPCFVPFLEARFTKCPPRSTSVICRGAPRMCSCPQCPHHLRPGYRPVERVRLCHHGQRVGCPGSHCCPAWLVAGRAHAGGQRGQQPGRSPGASPGWPAHARRRLNTGARQGRAPVLFHGVSRPGGGLQAPRAGKGASRRPAPRAYMLL